MALRAVIFDRDGVLTQFDTAAAAAFFRPLLPISIYALMGRWQQWGEQVGFPRSVAEEAVFLRGFWRQIGQEFGLDAAQQRVLDELEYARFMVAFPDASEALAALHGMGVRVGVLSNFSLASLEASLAAVGLAQWIDAACAATVIGAAKPDAAAYRTALATLDVTADECLFFDDELACVAGAEAVGMRAWLVDRAGACVGSERRCVSDLRAVTEIVARG